MAYSKQTWDTNSVFTPSRMNHIEDGIAGRIDFENLIVPQSVYNPANKTILQYLTDANTPNGFSIIFVQGASDNPRGNRNSFCLVYKGASNGTSSRLYVFETGYLYYAAVGSSVPSSLTWSRMESTPKYVDKQYTGLSAATSDYYTKLANNVYTDLGIPSTSKILSVTLLAFSGVNNSPISLGIDGSALVWTHGNGHSFTNAIIMLRVAYID